MLGNGMCVRACRLSVYVCVYVCVSDYVRVLYTVYSVKL